MMHGHANEMLAEGHTVTAILDAYVAAGISGLVYSGGTKDEIMFLVEAVLNKLAVMGAGQHSTTAHEDENN